MTNYIGSVGVYPNGPILSVGDTVTSPAGACTLELVSTGLVLTFQQQNPVMPVSGLVTVTSAKLKASCFVIYTANGGPYECAFPGLLAVRLCVEDNGEVVVYDEASNSSVLFSYNQGVPMQSVFPGPSAAAG